MHPGMDQDAINAQRRTMTERPTLRNTHPVAIVNTILLNIDPHITVPFEHERPVEDLLCTLYELRNAPTAHPPTMTDYISLRLAAKIAAITYYLGQQNPNQDHQQ